jgi:hypothetical protein
MSSPFDIDGPLLCDSALLAFLDIGSFPFLDGDATLSTLLKTWEQIQCSARQPQKLWSRFF